MVPADIFGYTQSTQSGGWKGFLHYQQLTGNVFGWQVAEGWVFIAALAAPVFRPGRVMARGALFLLEQGLRQASSTSRAGAVSHTDRPRAFL